MDVIRVVDVPDGTAADEAQRLLNVPSSENRYMLVQVLLLPGGVMRAVYRLLSTVINMDRNERVTNLRGNEDAARAALVEILKDSPKMGINKLRVVLKAKGYGKGQSWIAVTRCEILDTATPSE